MSEARTAPVAAPLAPAARGRVAGTETGETRLVSRFRAILVCAFLGLLVVAVAMVLIDARTEERQDRRVLTERLRSHAYLIDSQAFAFRQAAAALTARLVAPLAETAPPPARGAARRCGAAAAAFATGRRIAPSMIAPEGRRADGRSAPAPALSRKPRFPDWRTALAGVDFGAAEIADLAPNLAGLSFFATDGGGAVWIGERDLSASATAVFDAGGCARNPIAAPIWSVDVAAQTARLIAPVDVGAWRAGYLALDLDPGAIRRMNDDLALDGGAALDGGEALVLSGADAAIGLSGGASVIGRPVLPPAAAHVAADPLAFPSGDLLEVDDRLIFVQPLVHAPWTFMAVLPLASVREAALAETAMQLGVLLGLIAVALGLAVSLTRREFIRPAQALVAEIMAYGDGGRGEAGSNGPGGGAPGGASSPPPSHPMGWRPYFDRIRAVFDENADAASLRRELTIAARMQASILPKRFPGAEAPLSAWGAATPAQEVGGDFFDFFDLPGGRTGLVIADVSGKGVPAALFMVLARTLIRAAALDGAAPAAVLTRVNGLLAADNDETMFVTLFYAVADPAAESLTFANAGHNAPYLLRPEAAPSTLAAPVGVALGVFADETYEDAQSPFAPGETLVLFTDGVTEAMNGANAEYGEARLEAALDRTGAGATPETLGAAIEADVAAFVGAAPQADDLTLLVVRATGAGGAAPAEDDGESEAKGEATGFHARLGRDLAEIPAFAARLEAWCEAAGIDPAATHALSLSLDELTTNAMEYGGGGADFAIEIAVTATADAVTAVMRDRGAPFDPFSAPPPDLDAPAEDRPVGGLGVHFAKTLTDAQSYERRWAENIVTLMKRRAPAP